MPASKRLNYGPAKYAALHLLLGRWIRHHSGAGQFHYVTLGGTELRDIQSLHYINAGAVSGVVSYESKKALCTLAQGTGTRLKSVGLKIDIRRGDIFSFKRVNAEPHLFFIDVKGSFVRKEYDEKVAEWLVNDHVRPGDSLLITSHLGARHGWVTLLDDFTEELDTLEAAGEDNRKLCFRRSHPSFTLFRALNRIGYQSAIALHCFGCIEYRDKSPMSIFGYTVAEGKTSFLDLVRNAPYFHVRRGLEVPVLAGE
jgi:hypothetical protein